MPSAADRPDYGLNQSRWVFTRTRICRQILGFLMTTTQFNQNSPEIKRYLTRLMYWR
jgi:hypothetical protein